MPREVSHYHRRKHMEHGLLPLYAARLAYSIHFFLIIFINSTYLGQFVEPNSIGTIFTVGSAVSVLAFLFISRVLNQVGNFKLTIGLLIINTLATIGMAFTSTAELAIPLFVLLLIVQPLIYFNLDIFVESVTDNNVASTGTARAALLTIGSIVAATMPLISGVFIDDTASYTSTYLLSAAAVLPVIAIMFVNFRHFSDPPYQELDVFDAIHSFWVKKNIKMVFLAHFTLQIFFVFTTIYFPFYLINEIGLSWTEFGVTAFFAALAYIIVEYPAAYLADHYFGEKEMMALGFMIIALTISLFAFVTVPSVLIWSVIMFATRVGAALCEVTTEGYFFKKAKSSDAQVISFFRITQPLSMVIGGLTSSLALLYLPFNLLFIVGAFMMIPAMFFAIQLEDTK